MSKRTIVFLLIVILASVPALRALAIPGFYTSHDGVTHTARIANFSLALKEGQILPRLAPNLFGGLGFPIFVFIYPLPYLVGSTIHEIGFSFTDSFEIVIGASFLLSAISMFFFLRELFGETSALVGALFYSWAPYRFSQVYVRAAIAESFAYIFIPLVLLSALKLSRTRNTRWVGIGGLSLAGLLLSHQLVSLTFLPVFILMAFLFLRETKLPRQYLLSVAASALLGFTTAAFIYVPALLERKFLHFDELIDYYADHFVTIPQLIHSPWSYGFSMPGVMNDDMSFQVGLIHLTVVGLTVFWIGWRILHKQKILKTNTSRIGIASLAVFLVSTLLMLEHPAVRWVWEHIPGISILDFPWRLLGLSVFAASLLAAYLSKSVNSKLLYVLLLFFVFYANRNHLRINQSVVYDDQFFLNYRETATWRNEFLPKWRISNRFPNLKGDASVLEGDVAIEPLDIRTHKLRLKVQSRSGGILQLHRLYFPGWTVFLDGERMKFDEGFTASRNVQLETETNPFIDRSGLVDVRLPPGEHIVEARFSETLLRKAGFLMSGIGLSVSMWFTVRRQLVLSTLSKKSVPRRKR